MKKVEEKKTEPRPREWQRTGSCYLSSSVRPQLTGALSQRESWTISLQWSGICSLADLQNTTASSHHEARLLPIQMDGWLAAVTVSKNERDGGQTLSRYPISPHREHFFMYFFNNSRNWKYWPSLSSLTWTWKRTASTWPWASSWSTCSTLQSWESEFCMNGPELICSAHYILSSPTWFALTLFKMEEEISLRGVSCPQVHDHSDLMCTVSAVSREGHKDQSLKVGLSAI